MEKQEINKIVESIKNNNACKADTRNFKQKLDETDNETINLSFDVFTESNKSATVNLKIKKFNESMITCSVMSKFENFESSFPNHILESFILNTIGETKDALEDD